MRPFFLSSIGSTSLQRLDKISSSLFLQRGVMGQHPQAWVLPQGCLAYPQGQGLGVGSMWATHSICLCPPLEIAVLSAFIEVAKLQESMLKLSGRVKQAERNQLMCNRRQKKYIQKRSPLFLQLYLPSYFFHLSFFHWKWQKAICHWEQRWQSQTVGVFTRNCQHKFWCLSPMEAFRKKNDALEVFWKAGILQ